MLQGEHAQVWSRDNEELSEEPFYRRISLATTEFQMFSHRYWRSFVRENPMVYGHDQARRMSLILLLAIP